MSRGLIRGCLAVAMLATGPGRGWGDVDDLAPCPPPPGASDAEVVSHLLAQDLGTWRREAFSTADHGEIASLTPADSDLLALYGAEHASSARYRNTDGPGTATALAVSFPGALEALGFLAAHRTDQAHLVLLRSAAFRDGGVLHSRAGRYYLRVQSSETRTQALPADQYLAARIEVRLPDDLERPRLLALLPPNWDSPLAVSYGPTDLLGEGLSPLGLIVHRQVGAAPIAVTILELEDPAEAARSYTLMLERAMGEATVYAIDRLGEEAFRFRTGGGHVVGMRQDEYVAYVDGAARPQVAEGVMRLIGSAIRTSRPLPESEPVE